MLSLRPQHAISRVRVSRLKGRTNTVTTPPDHSILLSVVGVRVSMVVLSGTMLVLGLGLVW